jgi:hypothetical protein
MTYASSFCRGAAGGPEHREGRISHCLENTQSEILRVVYPERADRDSSLRSE